MAWGADIQELKMDRPFIGYLLILVMLAGLLGWAFRAWRGSTHQIHRRRVAHNKVARERAASEKQ